MKNATLWIDQYGSRVYARGRKGLLEKLGAKSCAKMYYDKVNGATAHAGYIVRGSWYSAYAPVEVRS